MSRLVYACRFEVLSERGLEEIAAIYSNWVCEHYQRNHNIQNFLFDLLRTTKPEALPDMHELSSASYEFDKAKVYKICWSQPDSNDSGLRWLNEIRIGQFGDRCSTEHLIFVNSTKYNITRVKLLLGSPRVVRDICAKASPYVGDMQIEAVPYNLRQSNFAAFIDLLVSDRRKLPIVFLSPYANGDANLINIEQMANKLAGTAIVMRIFDPEVTWDFTDEVGRSLSCFDGAARIYWPGFSMDSQPREHPLFLGEHIEKSPRGMSYAIQRLIFDVAAFRFVPDQKINDLVKNFETEERKKKIEENRKKGSDEFLGAYERDLAELETAQQRIKYLEIENANLKANQKAYFIPDDISTKEFDEVFEDITFSTVEKAVQAAENQFENINILSSAHRASRASPFRRPNQIYELLADLNGFIDMCREDMRQEANDMHLIQYLRKKGWGRSSLRISDTTRGKRGSNYEFIYKEERKLFEPHVTLGARDPNTCASVHFIVDQELEKVVVAHIGRHLPNTST